MSTRTKVTALTSMTIGVKGHAVVIGGIPGSLPRLLTAHKARVYAGQLMRAAEEAERRLKERQEARSREETP